MDSVKKVLDFLRDHQEDHHIIKTVLDEIACSLETMRNTNSALMKCVHDEINLYNKLVTEHNDLVTTCGTYANKKHDMLSNNEKLEQRKKTLHNNYKKGKKESKKLLRSIRTLESHINAVNMTIKECQKNAEEKKSQLVELYNQLEQAKNIIKDLDVAIHEKESELDIKIHRDADTSAFSAKPVKVFHVRTGMPKIHEKYIVPFRDEHIPSGKRSAKVNPLQYSTTLMRTPESMMHAVTTKPHPFAVQYDINPLTHST